MMKTRKSDSSLEISAPRLQMKLMHSLFSPLGALYHLRANRNIKIQERFAAVCRDLLALKDVPLVQEAFEHLGNDLTNSNVPTAMAAVEALKGMAETKDSIIPVFQQYS